MYKYARRDEMRGRPFRKGEGGRPKGTLNRFTELRQAFLQAFEEIGGAEALAAWALKHKTQFYLMIAGCCRIRGRTP